MKKFYSLHDFKRDVKTLANLIRKVTEKSGKHFRCIYGVPQGGIPLALELSRELGLPLVSSPTVSGSGDSCLVVDDIVDSGTTRNKYKKHPFAAIHKKPHAVLEGETVFFLHETSDWIVYWWEGDQERSIEGAVIRMLEYIGENPNREGLKETPKRVIKSWSEIYRGYNEEPPSLTVFKEDKPSGLIIDKGYFFSTCEHHLLPFFGEYWFGYIPKEEGVYLGASKIGRLIDHYSARAQVQERICKQVVSHIEEAIDPEGCILLMSARHLCKEMRGNKKYNSPYEHIEARGIFLSNEKGCKDEFIARIGSRI